MMNTRNIKRNKKKKQILFGLTLFSLLCILLVSLLVEPIPQESNYHNFADSREIWSISNFWNVVSNLPFFIVGILALYKLLKWNSLLIVQEVRASYILLFVGVSLVAFGSGYYHLDPNNETLVWDRLPMTIAFMALFSMVLSEFISKQLGKQMLLPLLLVGMGSVAYWFWGELHGGGDLRYYALVQFLPIVLIPVLLLSFDSEFTNISGYWWLLFCYFLAKIFEHFDWQIYEILGGMSGHSLKHMVAALGLYLLLNSFERRMIKK